mgnify:CR=1 FL=1
MEGAQMVGLLIQIVNDSFTCGTMLLLLLLLLIQLVIKIVTGADDKRTQTKENLVHFSLRPRTVAACNVPDGGSFRYSKGAVFFFRSVACFAYADRQATPCFK